MEGIRHITTEMKATLADLKTQVGRDMPQFDKLAANITALEALAEEPKAATAAAVAVAPEEKSSGLFGISVPDADAEAPDAEPKPLGPAAAAKSSAKPTAKKK